MSKKNKNNMDMFRAFMPPMPFMPNGKGFGWFASQAWEEEKEEPGSSMKKFWEQMIDVQKSAMDLTKEQWEQFVENMMALQKNFASSMPDKLPSPPQMPFAPSFPDSPKKFKKQMKKFMKQMERFQ